MRLGIAVSALFLLSLVSLLHSENNTTAPLQPNSQYITALSQYIVPHGEAFSIESFTHQGATAYAVSAPSSGVSAIFVLQGFTGKAEPLTERQEIESALQSYYLSRGFDSNAISKLEVVHSGFAGIKNSRKSGEAECFRLMGQENRPCGTDFELCKAYCIGTPFCNNFAYGGELGEFINVIVQFRNNTAFLDEAYLNESMAYAALNSSPTKESVSAYLASIGGINRAATRVSASILFLGYSFCFTPDYSLPAITSLQLSAQNAFRQGSPFLSLSETAQAIESRTLGGIASKEKYDAALEKARADAEKKQNETKNQSKNVTIYLNASENQTVQPEPEAQKFISADVLAVGAGLIAVLALAVAFYVVKLRGNSHREKSDAFERAEEDIRKGRR